MIPNFRAIKNTERFAELICHVPGKTKAPYTDGFVTGSEPIHGLIFELCDFLLFAQSIYIYTHAYTYIYVNYMYIIYNIYIYIYIHINTHTYGYSRGHFALVGIYFIS